MLAMSFVLRLTQSISGVYRSPEVRFLLRIRKSTPNPPCRLSSPRHGFYSQCHCDPNHDNDSSPLSSILQAWENEISHTHDGELFSSAKQYPTFKLTNHSVLYASYNWIPCPHPHSNSQQRGEHWFQLFPGVPDIICGSLSTFDGSHSHQLCAVYHEFQ